MMIMMMMMMMMMFMIIMMMKAVNLMNTVNNRPKSRTSWSSTFLYYLHSAPPASTWLANVVRCSRVLRVQSVVSSLTFQASWRGERRACVDGRKQRIHGFSTKIHQSAVISLSLHREYYKPIRRGAEVRVRLVANHFHRHFELIISSQHENEANFANFEKSMKI